MNNNEITNLECPRCGKRCVEIFAENGCWPIICNASAYGECLSVYDCKSRGEAMETYDALMECSEKMQEIYNYHR